MISAAESIPGPVHDRLLSIAVIIKFDFMLHCKIRIKTSFVTGPRASLCLSKLSLASHCQRLNALLARLLSGRLSEHQPHQLHIIIHTIDFNRLNRRHAFASLDCAHATSAHHYIVACGTFCARESTGTIDEEVERAALALASIAAAAARCTATEHYRAIR